MRGEYVARRSPTVACHLAPVPRLKIGLALQGELDILIVAGCIFLRAGYATHRAAEGGVSWLPPIRGAAAGRPSKLKAYSSYMQREA